MELLTVFAGGLVSGFIGAMAGGGGLVAIPILIFAGLPAHMAIATNRVGAFGMGIGGAVQYGQKKKIIWKYVLPLSIVTMIGGFIGANLLVSLDADLVSNTIGYVILILLPFALLQNNLGVHTKKVSGLTYGIGWVAIFLMTIGGGLLGAGLAPFFYMAYIYFFGFTIINAVATNKIPIIAASASSLVVFVGNDLVNWPFGAALFVGMLIGSYMGAHTAVKQGSAWVYKVFVIVTVASAVKLIFF